MKNKPAKDKTTMPVREVAALIEDLRSQFRIFGEKLSAVSDKLDATYEEVGRQKEEIFSIKTKLDMTYEEVSRHSEEIFSIKTKLGMTIDKLDATSDKVDMMYEDVKIIKADVAEIKETLKGHEKRITHLETVVK